MSDGSSDSNEPDASATEVKQLGLPLWNKDVPKLSSEHFFSEQEINLFLEHLFSNDYETRQKAIAYLTINQYIITPVLVKMLVNNITHYTLLFQLTYALEIIGKTAVPVLLESLNQIQEIKNSLDETLLENICETLIRVNDKSSVPVLLRHLQNIKEKIDVLNETIGENSSYLVAKTSAEHSADQNTAEKDSSLRKKLEFYQSVREKIHYLLGEMNSTSGLDDLLVILGDGSRRVNGEIIETLSKIGNKQALIPLVKIYPIEAQVSELGARYIKLTCREIIRREKISKSDLIFNNLSDVEKETLDKILAGYRNGKH
jgi:HEAT repeat protein